MLFWLLLPPPVDTALSSSVMDSAVEQALAEARQKNIRGQQVTPFLLSQVSELTGRASLNANIDLLLNNAQIAAQIAVAYHGGPVSKKA